jgi:hypothetical protein
LQKKGAAGACLLLRGEQFWIDVVNCTMREATYVLDCLLYQDAPEIKELYTDTAGYTDLVFGLFTLLGFRFAPRLRDLPDQTLYRTRKGFDYGVLMPTLKKDIRVDLIVQHWDDLNRIAASLKDGLIRPSLLISKLQAKQQQNPIQQALQELGRIAKTLHILEYVDDPALRRRVLIGLNKGEHLHSLARNLAFGRQGRFHDRGYEAQLNRASALSLCQKKCGNISPLSSGLICILMDRIILRGSPSTAIFVPYGSIKDHALTSLRVLRALKQNTLLHGRKRRPHPLCSSRSSPKRNKRDD